MGKKANDDSPLAPGWYPDPDRVNTLTYWDGDQFTESAPMPPVPVGAPLWKQARVIALGILMAVAVIWGIWMITAPTEAECALDELGYTLDRMNGKLGEKPSWRCP